MRFIALVSLAALTSATPKLNHLTKRCSPARDPEYLHGYLPPVPCWQVNDPACRPYLAEDTEMTLDAEHGVAIIYGVSDSCASDIKEEIARTEDGRKNFGWLKRIGKLSLIGDGILVISGMSDETVEEYKKLKYFEPGDWS